MTVERLRTPGKGLVCYVSWDPCAVKSALNEVPNRRAVSQVLTANYSGTAPLSMCSPPTFAQPHRVRSSYSTAITTRKARTRGSQGFSAPGWTEWGNTADPLP